MINQIAIDDFTTPWGSKLYLKILIIHQWISLIVFFSLAIAWTNQVTNNIIANSHGGNTIEQIEVIRGVFMLATIMIIIIFSELIKRTANLVLTRPLNAFMEFVHGLQHGNLDLRFRAARNDEFGELSKCLDNLLDENSDLLEKQKLTEKLKVANQELKENIEILKKTQDKVIEMEKLSYLGDLVVGVSHEINTPLGNALVGSSTAINSCNTSIQKIKDVKDNTGKITYDEIIESFQEIKSVLGLAVDNLNKTSSLVTSFKQIAVDQTQEERTNINILEQTNKIAKINLDKYPNTKYKIKVNCPETLIFPIYATSYMTFMSNLIQNSFLHAFEGREEGAVTIDIKEYRGSMLIKLSDNGVGMNADTMSKIFNPFFTTKRGSQGGVGLGAHLTHNIIVAKFRGEINVESKENQGTTFNIKLPK